MNCRSADIDESHIRVCLISPGLICRLCISPNPNPCQRLKGLALRANLELLFGFFIYFPGGNSGLRKGFPDLHDSFISIESHGALIFNVGDDDCHGLSALGYDDLFLIAQDFLEQPAELFPPLGYMEGDVGSNATLNSA